MTVTGEGSSRLLVVNQLDDEGAGVGTPALDPSQEEPSPPEGPLEVHVPGALPGETVSIRIDHVSSHRAVAWATLQSIHAAAPSRVPAACPAHGRCGGCVLQHFDVAAQRLWKQERLRKLLAATPALARVPVNATVASPRMFGYRNNSKLVPARDGRGGLILGAFAPRSHLVIDLAGCAIVEPVLDQAASILRELLVAAAVEPYHEATATGLLRYAVLRANAVGEVLVTLVTASDFAGGPAFAQDLRQRQPGIVGVVQNVNTTRGNAIYGDVERTLDGSAAIEDDIGGVRLRVSSRAFFQANRQVAALAYRAIAHATALTPTDRVVDVYAGVGGIALTLAPHAGTVIGIEEHANAVRDATANATLNQIDNATFVAGDAEACLQSIDAADVVVLNPPRKGCSAGVLQRIAALGPRTITYLSCAPDTLVRDLAVLARHGYRSIDLTPFDMMPHTPHIETLAVLTR